MSTLKVASINNPAAASGGLAISATGAVSGAGLDHIVTETFTAQSAVSVDGCFTADYDNYRVVVTGTNTGANRLYLRMRLSGSDATGASDYKNAGFYSDTSPASGAIDNSNGTSSANLGYLAAGGASSVDIYSPAIATVTKMRSNCIYKAGANIAQITFACSHEQNVAYSGLSIFSTSGTNSGSLSVYGYKS